MQKKSLARPDETRSFDKGKVELVTVNDFTFGLATLQPGWKWSTCVKPLVHTRSCEAAHLQYHIAGRLHVVLDRGYHGEAPRRAAGRSGAGLNRGPEPGTAWRVILPARPLALPSERAMNRASFINH